MIAPMLSTLRKLFARAGAPAPLGPDAFQQLAEHTNDVILRCGADGTYHYVSPSSARVLGWEPEEMIGKPASAFVLPADLPLVMAAFAQHRNGDEATVNSVRLRRKDGTALWMEGSARTIHDPATNEGEIVVVLRDISERKRLEEQLSRLAMTDGLTGLANRRAFDEKLENEWLRARRNKGQLSLLLMDLDHFKRFNDHYGHQVGDDCLRAVALAIQAAVRRPADLAARYGGEEIAVILPDTDATGAAKVAEEIRNAVVALRIPHIENVAGGRIVTLSTGVATALSRGGASEQMPAGLLQAADMALYKAKHNGRNRVETALLLSGDRSDAA